MAKKAIAKPRIKIKILKPLRGYPVGKIIPVDVDKKGVPLDKYWRARLKDSKVDKCIEIMENGKNNKIIKAGSITK